MYIIMNVMSTWRSGHPPILYPQITLWLRWRDDMPTCMHCRVSNGLSTLYLVRNQISNYDAFSNVEHLLSRRFQELAKLSISSTR